MGARHRKTRKEKITADYRHQIYTLKNEEIPLSKPVLTETLNKNSFSNTHILKDIIKTGILTFAIVIAQITLSILLKKHIIILPNVNY